MNTWITQVEAALFRLITANHDHAWRMITHALDQGWLERWHRIETTPRQTAWNVASLYWGWLPKAAHEVPS